MLRRFGADDGIQDVIALAAAFQISGPSLPEATTAQGRASFHARIDRRHFYPAARFGHTRQGSASL